MTSPSEQIILTEDQDSALDKFVKFLFDPDEQVFVLEGYSGTGKSTLIKTLIQRLPGYIEKAEKTIRNYRPLEVVLTATTNKAAETFSDITGMGVSTIHSFLGLRVSKDYLTGESRLIPKSGNTETGYLIFIDEASYIDSDLLDLIFKKLVNCKIVFIGDRAQLVQFRSVVAPVFQSNFNGAMLSKVVRQAEGNPIIELATMFRNVVNGESWGKIKVDGEVIRLFNRSDFEDEILAEFMRPDWHYSDSKVLAWTNACVTRYNNAISEHVTGDPEFKVGDYAVCNNFVSNKTDNISTDALVFITHIGPDIEEHGVIGNAITLDYLKTFFLPKTLVSRKERLKMARANDEWKVAETIESRWIDLRPMFAQTLNKSQGSTYDKVFIDLDDIKKCNSGNALARMLYVGVSRARFQVNLVGDLV